MPSNTIVMPIDIKQNRNALSKVYGHYFPEVHCRQTLSTYGLAKHMSDHGSLVSEEILRLVLRGGGQSDGCQQPRRRHPHPLHP